MQKNVNSLENVLTKGEYVGDRHWDGQTFLSLPLAFHYKLDKKRHFNSLSLHYSYLADNFVQSTLKFEETLQVGSSARICNTFHYFSKDQQREIDLLGE